MTSHVATIGMHARAAVTIGVLFVAASLAGCGAGRDLKGSMTAYERGNFHRAIERCEMTDEGDLDDKGQVRYYVYCGLAYYKVGRPSDARQLLVNGQKLYTSGDPEWLKPLIVDAMNKALANLNLAAPPPPPALPVATARAQSKDPPRNTRQSDDQYE